MWLGYNYVMTLLTSPLCCSTGGRGGCSSVQFSVARRGRTVRHAPPQVSSLHHCSPTWSVLQDKQGPGGGQAVSRGWDDQTDVGSPPVRHRPGGGRGGEGAGAGGKSGAGPGSTSFPAFYSYQVGFRWLYDEYISVVNKDGASKVEDGRDWPCCTSPHFHPVPAPGNFL